MLVLKEDTHYKDTPRYGNRGKPNSLSGRCRFCSWIISWKTNGAFPTKLPTIKTGRPLNSYTVYAPFPQRLLLRKTQSVYTDTYIRKNGENEKRKTTDYDTFSAQLHSYAPGGTKTLPPRTSRRTDEKILENSTFLIQFSALYFYCARIKQKAGARPAVNMTASRAPARRSCPGGTKTLPPRHRRSHAANVAKTAPFPIQLSACSHTPGIDIR